MKVLDGRWTAGAIIAVATGALAVGTSSLAAFLMLGSLVLAGTGYAAFHWPQATLVAVAVTTLLDPGVATRFLPPALAQGPIGISEPLLVVTGLVALIRIRRAGINAALRDPVFGLMVLFVLVAVASALANGTPPGVAVLGIVMTVDAMVIFFLWVALEPSPKENARAIASVVIAVAVVALFGVSQVVIAPNILGFERVASRPEDIGRITSFLGNPNLMAPILGLALPFPLYAGLRVERRAYRAGALLIGLLLIAALILTVSRGTWLAASIGIVIGTLLIEWRVLAIAVLLAGISILLVAWMPKHVAYPEATPRTSSEPQPPAPDAAPPPDPFRGMTSEEVRLYFLRTGMNVVMDNPVLGVGPGRYGGAAATIVPSPVYAEYEITLGRLRTVHNFWLHLAGEVGIAGVTVFVTLLVALFLRLRRAARQATGTKWVVLAAVATSVAVVGMNNATEMVFEGNIPAVIVWLVFAVGATLAPHDARPVLRRRRAIS